MSSGRPTARMSALLDMVRRAGAVPFHELPVAEARAAYEKVAEILDLPRAPLHRVQNLRIPVGEMASVPARMYVPERAAQSGTPAPVMLYFHGGGFTSGSLETHDSLCRQIALRSGACVLSVAYRLAPEHRFPTAVDDCWAAVQWLRAEAASLGLDGQRIGVAGDSAGGTLAAVCSLLARDAGLPLALQVLITPGTAADASHASRARFAQGYLLEERGIEWFFNHYIAPECRTDWRFAPLEADDLSDVAPAWVGVAECDPLADEGIAYADRLRMAGVPVQLEVAKGVTHDFIKLGRSIPEALVAMESIASAIKEALRP